MTDARLTQSALQALINVEADTRLTQSALQILCAYDGVPDEPEPPDDPGPDPFDPDLNLPTSPPVDLLSCMVDGYAKCWLIWRDEGGVPKVLLATTDADVPVSVPFYGDTLTYLPYAGPTGSAIESASVLTDSSAGYSLRLNIGDGTPNEIREKMVIWKGKYVGARINLTLYPRNGYTGASIPLMSGLISGAKVTHSSVEMDIQTVSATLNDTVITHTVSASCRWRYGSARCGVNAGSLAQSSSVYKVAGGVTGMPAWDAFVEQFAGKHRCFSVPSPDFEFWSKFYNGIIKFTDGDNEGVAINGLIVLSNESTNELNIMLTEPAPFEIKVGDPFLAIPGCNHTMAACAKKGNQNRFGGFPAIPGTAKVNKIYIKPEA